MKNTCEKCLLCAALCGTLMIATATAQTVNTDRPDAGVSAGNNTANGTQDDESNPRLSVAPPEPVAGKSDATSSEELAKKLANPIADLISIPFQFNYDEGYGPEDAGFWRLNIQPVIPFALNEDWNLITRTIVPLIYQESLADGVDSEFGLGDIVQSFFFSPKQPANGWIWGVGPVFNWPTATDTALGSEKWGAGPTAVLLKQECGWTYGVLANHIWSFAGDHDREDMNLTFLQPFLAYTFPTATTITLNTESTYDWDEDQWTVPINLMAGQMVRIGKRPMNFQIGGRYYAEAAEDGPEWGLRFQITYLIPK